MSKILIVETDPGILKLYRDALREEGFIVETMPDVQAFVDKVLISKPDIILLDFEIPFVPIENLIKDLFKRIPNKDQRPKIVIYSSWQTQVPAELVQKYELSGFFVKLKASIVKVIELMHKVSEGKKVNWFEAMSRGNNHD